MTRLRNLAVAGLAALAIGGAASAALAEESASFQNRLSAASIGLPLGALPPAGLYTGLETAYLGMPNVTPTTGTFLPGGARATLPAIANAVPLLWSTGWNFLGASYGAAVVQAFYNNNTCNLGNNCVGAGFFGKGGDYSTISGDYTTANTTISPIILSWNLGQGWFVSTGFTFMPPDGTKGVCVTCTVNTPNPDYWTFEIPLAISYLGNNWNISGNFYYDINGPSNGTCCVATPGVFGTITSGNLFYGDLHWLWKFGKWSIGPVGAFEVQTTADTGCTAAANALGICNRFSNAQVGGLVGYDFGPVDLQVWVTDVVAEQNGAVGPGNISVFTRLGFKLWGPDAPRPLVAKN